MPKKYLWLDVLEYEKKLLYSDIINCEINMDSVQDWDWYTEEEKQQQVERYQSILSKHQSKMQFIDYVISKYADSFTMEHSYSSTEPLQEYYQEEIDRLLSRFKKDIKDYYNRLFNTLMSTGPISITYFAKINAKNLTLYYGIKSIVTEYLFKQQIDEINRLSNPKKEQLTAIKHKYDFFIESLVDCFPLIQEAKKL